MATVYRRMQHLKVSTSQEIKMKIGSEVCEAYFAQKKRPKIYKIKSIEPEGEFQALSYPKSFHPTIDKIILKHCGKPRAKRPRTNRVGSSRPDQK